MTVKTVCLKISGRVQGVGFRRWAWRTAAEIGGISGWVRNTEDGGVEILMRAEEKAADLMILACQRGPAWARVDQIAFMSPVARGFLPDIIDGKFEIV